MATEINQLELPVQLWTVQYLDGLFEIAPPETMSKLLELHSKIQSEKQKLWQIQEPEAQQQGQQQNHPAPAALTETPAKVQQIQSEPPVIQQKSILSEKKDESHQHIPSAPQPQQKIQVSSKSIQHQQKEHIQQGHPILQKHASLTSQKEIPLQDENLKRLVGEIKNSKAQETARDEVQQEKAKQVKTKAPTRKTKSKKKFSSSDQQQQKPIQMRNLCISSNIYNIAIGEIMSLCAGQDDQDQDNNTSNREAMARPSTADLKSDKKAVSIVSKDINNLESNRKQQGEDFDMVLANKKEIEEYTLEELVVLKKKLEAQLEKVSKRIKVISPLTLHLEDTPPQEQKQKAPKDMFWHSERRSLRLDTSQKQENSYTQEPQMKKFRKSTRPPSARRISSQQDNTSIKDSTGIKRISQQVPEFDISAQHKPYQTQKPRFGEQITTNNGNLIQQGKHIIEQLQHNRASKLRAADSNINLIVSELPVTVSEDITNTNLEKHGLEKLKLEIPADMPAHPENYYTSNDLMELGKKVYEAFGIACPQTSLLNIKKFKNCVYYRLQSTHVVWYYEGKFYIGGWKAENNEGEKEGWGFEWIPEKYIYLGQFKQGRRHGYGKIKYHNGDFYEGQWEKGLRHGKGSFVQAGGASYSGDWKESKRDGHGKLIISDKEVYQGDFSRGIKNGQGKETFKTGDSYEGQYQMGKFSGKGVYKWSNGAVYEGQFMNGCRNGKGKWRSGDEPCDVYQGEYLNDKKCGMGKYTWENGSSYEGQFLNDLRQGDGVLRFVGGKVLRAIWENGVAKKKLYCEEEEIYKQNKSKSQLRTFSAKVRGNF